jgi:predicted permease
MMQDLRFAARSLARTPGFAIVATLTLALGIGGTTAMFTLVNRVLLQPLAYHEPGRLVVIRESIRELSHLYPVLPANILHVDAWGQRCAGIESITALRPRTLNLTGAGDPMQVNAVFTSASVLKVLGVQPAIGRGFTPEEESAGHDRVVVLSHGFWQRLGGDPNILGRQITLDGRNHLVAGILPASFHFPRATSWTQMESLQTEPDLIKPEAIDRSEISLMAEFNYATFARLRPGVTVQQVNAQIDSIQSEIVRRSGEKLHLSAKVDTMQEVMVSDSRRGLLLLLGAVGMVLLIVCVNLANLLLVRGAGRAREVSIRLALGGSRGDMLRLSLLESTLLAIPGGLLGLLLAWGGLRLLLRGAPIEIPRAAEVSLDWQAAAFALLLSLATTMLFGLIPALRLTAVDPQDTLKSGSHTVSEGRQGARTRSLLVAAQMGLSAALLIFAGLLSTSLFRLLKVDKGFRAEHVIAADVVLPAARYGGDEKERTRFYDQSLANLRAIPGVDSAALVSHIPLQGETWINALTIAGDTRPLLERPMANMRFVSPGYFQTMGIELRAGRDFNESDRNVPRIILTQRAADKLWPGQNPLGRKLQAGGSQELMTEVIGIIRDSRLIGLDRDPVLMAYLPHWQRSRLPSTFMVRTSMAPESLAGAIRNAVRQADADVPVATLRSMSEVVDRSVARRRFQMSMALVFAGFALLLAGLGVYGVVSYWVERRRVELGIRSALGARREQLFALVLRQGLLPVAAGLVAGIAAALAGSRLVESLLFGVKATEPLIYVAVIGGMLALALLSCALPARRAAAIEPWRALRYE